MDVISRSWPSAKSLVLLVGLFTVPVSASGQTVLIDFGNDASFRGLSVNNPDANGNHWNSLRTGVFYQNLIDTTNASTNIDFGFSTPVATDSFNGPAGPTDASMLETDVLFTDIDATALGNLGGALEAAFDYVAGPDLPDNRVRFEIQQLDPAKKYNLTFFGSHKFSTDSTTVYSVYSDNTYSTVVGTASLDVQDPVAPFNVHNRDRVATISNLSPQASDILYVEFVGSAGGLGYLNDMQIEAVTAVLPGDYDGSGVVDAADYVVWRDDPTTHGGDPAGYATWRENFGRSLAGTGDVASSTVPEPASFMMAVGTALGLFARRRRTT
jgi:hypothetical protein